MSAEIGARIVPVDPFDDEAFKAFYEVYLACGREDQHSFVPSPYDELLSVLRRPTEDFSYKAWLARRGHEVVGSGWYARYRRANRDKVAATPRVLPRHRRRGIGSALLRHLETEAIADGRTTLLSSPRWAKTHGPQGYGAGNVEFARRHGHALALVEAKRRLPLPVASSLLDRLTAAADPAYTIHAFAGPIPKRWVADWAELEASLPTEAPTGDIDTEEYPPSVEAVRDAERVLAESGRMKFNALALAPDGSAAGYSDIVVGTAGEPAMQEGTLVRRIHRGHGLGPALKAAVLRLIQEQRPDVGATITSNALDNVAMVAVNDRLGYEVIGYLGDVQKRLG